MLFYEVALDDSLAVKTIQKFRPGLYLVLAQRKEVHPAFAYHIMGESSRDWVAEAGSQKRIQNHLRKLLQAELRKK